VEPVSYQPLIDALAFWLTFWAWPYMVMLTWIVLLFGRDTWRRWLEAAGWHGVVGFFSRLANGLRPGTFLDETRDLERPAIKNETLAVSRTTIEGSVEPSAGHTDRIDTER
jgi:hypothetical protein